MGKSALVPPEDAEKGAVVVLNFEDDTRISQVSRPPNRTDEGALDVEKATVICNLHNAGLEAHVISECMGTNYDQVQAILSQQRKKDRSTNKARNSRRVKAVTVWDEALYFVVKEPKRQGFSINANYKIYGEGVRGKDERNLLGLMPLRNSTRGRQSHRSEDASLPRYTETLTWKLDDDKSDVFVEITVEVCLELLSEDLLPS